MCLCDCCPRLDKVALNLSCSKKWYCSFGNSPFFYFPLKIIMAWQHLKAVATVASNKTGKTYEINFSLVVIGSEYKKEMLLDLKLAALLICASSKCCPCAVMRGSCIISCWSRLNSLYCQNYVRSGAICRVSCFHVYVFLFVFWFKVAVLWIVSNVLSNLVTIQTQLLSDSQ